jgi:glutamyl-tRNA reductase
VKLFVAGLSFKTAPVELREQLAVMPSKLSCFACQVRLGAGLAEIVLLSTCNRVEIYAVGPSPGADADRLFHFLTAKPLNLRQYMYLHEDAAALRHLFSVASGLDSLVIGETEITGQVKQAYETAHAAGLTGAVLNRAFQKALQTAKKIRTRTSVGRGATSVGSVAVELAEKIFRHDLSQQTVIIIGAGQMGETCVRHLAKKGARSILVSNRAFDRAQQLAAEFGGRAIRFDDLLSAVTEADIVVSSTGCPRTILHRADVEAIMRARRNRPLFLIDIAVPRDIDADVQRLDNVYLYDIDDLETVARENVRLREQELAVCRALIEANAAVVLSKLHLYQESTNAADAQWGVQPQFGRVPRGTAACDR